jgi:hypothetical protein
MMSTCPEALHVLGKGLRISGDPEFRWHIRSLERFDQNVKALLGRDSTRVQEPNTAFRARSLWDCIGLSNAHLDPRESLGGHTLAQVPGVNKLRKSQDSISSLQTGP